MPHHTRPGGSIRYLAHDDILMATDNDDISIYSTEEMEKYESLHRSAARVAPLPWGHTTQQ
jgi:hypothetical protein